MLDRLTKNFLLKLIALTIVTVTVLSLAVAWQYHATEIIIIGSILFFVLVIVLFFSDLHTAKMIARS
jgi:uncharacterized membrane protein